MKMKWTFMLILGSSLAVTTLCWTYHYSNDTMNWTTARQWCQASYTDLVVIQNEKENEALVSFLPKRNSSPYFWIGISRNNRNESWIWVGNNSTWIGNNSWAAGEPNNVNNEFCVEIYTSKGKEGKWNDEPCNYMKYAACYKAQCNATSCERGRCQETIGNTTCLCERGFKGDRCQTAVECPPLSQPENGNHNCSGGNQTFDTTCQFNCNPGYVLNGSSVVTCGDTELWSGTKPNCAAVTCPPLSGPEIGDFSCLGNKQAFNTTCHFGCAPGFLLIGSPTVTCGNNGVWGPRPTCASYKQALLAVAGCGAFSAFGCFCFCWMKHRKRKNLTQERHPEEANPSCDAHA